MVIQFASMYCSSFPLPAWAISAFFILPFIKSYFNHSYWPETKLAVHSPQPGDECQMYLGDRGQFERRLASLSLLLLLVLFSYIITTVFIRLTALGAY